MDNRGTTGTERRIARYLSVADFVHEVRVVPPLAFTREVVTTSTGGGITTTNTATFTYDGQNRLVQRHDSNLSSTLVYTAWDVDGRVTAGNGLQTGDTVSIVYDNAARSQATTAISPSSPGQSVTTLIYDANGNPMSSRSTISTPLGQNLLDVNYSTAATLQICS